MCDLSGSEIQDVVCGLKQIQADDQPMDARGEGWQSVANGSRTTKFKEYQTK